MYRVVLYYLIALVGIAMVIAAFGGISLDPMGIFFSAAFLVCFGAFVNDIFAHVFEVPANIESTYITSLILALIVPPPTHMSDFLFLVWVSILANSSKYIVAIRNKHIFNPVAIAVALTSICLGQSATWWIGNAYMAPFVLVGGWLVVRKMRREKIILSFMIIVIALSLITTFIKGTSLYVTMDRLFLHSSYLFLAFAMLTEPLTSPHTEALQIFFAAFVGVLFVPDIKFGSLSFSPETALLVGNFYSYLVSPKERIALRLKEIVRICEDSFDYIFDKPKGFSYESGQYMEWTLGHNKVDSRGNRRYFTLASSPSEDTLRIGVKHYAGASSYKKSMQSLQVGQTVVASQRAGDFVLSRDVHNKYVFIAGGIGITPYRSMLKHMVDTHESRDVILFYINKLASEIAYMDVIDAATKVAGLRAVLSLTDRSSIPATWSGERGRLDSTMLTRYVHDYLERIFYISGPNSMVDATRKMLLDMGIPAGRIKTDFFPGFA